LTVENYYSFKSAVILSEYHKGGPTSHHLSNYSEIHHFHFKALQNFLTGIVLAFVSAHIHLAKHFDICSGNIKLQHRTVFVSVRLHNPELLQ
jgi:hypothetical protein